MNTLTITAPAKINLGLEVLYRRPDSYHEINTIFIRTCLQDELTFSLKEENITIQMSPNLDLEQKNNLIFKAAELLKQNFNIRKGVDILVNKKIPSGAGLGGGSSDAASTLLALNKLWEINCSENELSEIALQLGSDVPYFLKEGAAFAQGRGEKLEYFDYQLNCPILLVNPNIHIPTPWAFNELNRSTGKKQGTNFKSLLEKNIPFDDFGQYFKNDFEEVVFKQYPEIERIKAIMLKNGATFASLSGSGSTIYGLYRDIETLENSCKHFHNYQIFKCL